MDVKAKFNLANAISFKNMNVGLVHLKGRCPEFIPDCPDRTSATGYAVVTNMEESEKNFY